MNPIKQMQFYILEQIITSKASVSKPIITTILLILVGISLVVTMLVFWLLWRRKRQYRRKSKSCSIIPMDLKDREPDGISRSSTASGSRSISPLINYLYEKNNPNIDVISVSEQPHFHDETNQENKKYALKEVDRICMEALRGKNTITPKQKPRRVSSTSVQKTLSSGSCYSSSGYGSGCSSPSLHLPRSAASSNQFPYPLLDNR